jgi:hypothetical protein
MRLRALADATPEWSPDAAADGEPEGEGDGAARHADDRPEVLVTPHEADVNDQVIAHLAGDPGLFQRNRKLVRLGRYRKAGTKKKSVDRPDGSLLIAEFDGHALRERITRVVRLRQTIPTADGFKEINVHPPGWMPPQILGRGEWAGIPPMTGIVEAPTLRPDGGVVERPGYDEETGLYYEPAIAFPAIPAAPTRDDAKAAAKDLLGLVREFTFKRDDKREATWEEHRAVWLSALLTVLCRHLVDGPVPLHFFSSGIAGAGKTLLADTVAFIALGRMAARTTYRHDAVETDKQIVATCLAGDLLVLLDNAENGGEFGNAALDAALTGTTYRGRILGTNEMPPLDHFTVWLATGNNPVYVSDVHRRTLVSRIEPDEEHPENKSGYEHDDLRGYVLEHRGELVVNALTTVRAYLLAGSPKPDLLTFGTTYAAWERVVRHAIHWATGVDVCGDRTEIDMSRGEKHGDSDFLDAWEDVQDANGGQGMRAKDFLQWIRGSFDPELRRQVKDVLRGIWSRLKEDELPSERALARF